MLHNYLKRARENVGLTQERAGELIDGVSVNTIQNWEKETYPDKSYWPSIIKAYSLSRVEFMKEFEKSVFEDYGKDINEDISLLLSLIPEKYSFLKDMVFTEEEMEFLAHFIIVNGRYTVITDEKFCGPQSFIHKISKMSASLPIEYVNKKGAMVVLSLEKSIYKKLLKIASIGQCYALFFYIVDYMIEYNKPFSIYQLTLTELLKILEICNNKIKTVFVDNIFLLKEIHKNKDEMFKTNFYMPLSVTESFDINTIEKNLTTNALMTSINATNKKNELLDKSLKLNKNDETVKGLIINEFFKNRDYEYFAIFENSYVKSTEKGQKLLDFYYNNKEFFNFVGSK